MTLAIKPFDAPIPGENFTSDTKNYPWHRPPKFTDLDTAIEYMIKKIVQPEVGQSLFTFMEMGVTVASLVDMLVTEGIGQGKWTVDFAVLMAGPLAHVICLMAKAYDVEYDLGIESKSDIPTKAYIKALKQDRKAEKEKARNTDSDIVKELLSGQLSAPQSGGMTGGFAGAMAAQPNPMAAQMMPEEQMEMMQ